jgi:hypothetical protein
MDHDIAYELGFLLGEHNAGRADMTKSAKGNCPGGKIRSKGKGRGLGRGKGKGPMGKPIGRALAMKYGWKDPKTKKAGGETKEAFWAQAAMLGASIGLPMLADWWQNRGQGQQQQGQQAGAYGAGGGGGAYSPQQGQQSYFGFKPTSTRQVAQPAYQYGERMASNRAAESLVKMAMVKLATQFAFPAGGAYSGGGGGGTLPTAYQAALRRSEERFGRNALHGGSMDPSQTFMPETAMAAGSLLGGGGGGGGTTAATTPAAGGGTAAPPASKGTALGKGLPSTRAQRARISRGIQRHGMGWAEQRGYDAAKLRNVMGSRGMSRLQAGRTVGRFATPGIMSRMGKGLSGIFRKPMTLGRLGKWGLIGGLGALAAPAIWKGLKGAYHGIMGTTPEQKAQAGGKGVSLYSPEERRQFARIGVDPRQALAAQSAAGALQAGGAFRRAQHQNWLRAANAMMLTGMNNQKQPLQPRYAG